MITRKQLKLKTDPQLPMFHEAGDSSSVVDTQTTVGDSTLTAKKRFIRPDPNLINVANGSLKSHLEEAQQRTPFIVADLLDEQDWSDFEQRYSPIGRPAYAPRAMVGVILFGIMQGVTSLRTLERMARLNLGCMWVSGGIFPDHANIGRFIVEHSESLQSSFFVQLTQAVLRKTQSDGHRLAGDGTTIEAACSNYSLIKEEAALQTMEKAQEITEKKPDDAKHAKALEKACEVHEAVRERNEKRKSNGRKADARISPTEPEAVVQKAKRGRGYAPSYTPSVLANSERVVVAHDVDPSSETAVISTMLDQSSKVTGEKVSELLLDAGYCNDEVIHLSLEQDISLLCPEGKRLGKPKKSKKFHKGDFKYNEAEDVYECPAGQKLVHLSSIKQSERTKAQKTYGDASCDGCPLKTQCTANKKGRVIKRYEADEAKEALRQVMQQRKAQKVFSKRKAMVEPVFSHLRNIQGLQRFRRKGLQSVKLEFSLHLLAYNMSRAVAAAFWLYFWLIWSRSGVFSAKTVLESRRFIVKGISLQVNSG